MHTEVIPSIKHDTDDVKPKPRPPRFKYWSFEKNHTVKYKPDEMPLPDEPFSKASIAKDIARHAPGYRACGYAAVIRDGKIYFSYRATQ